MSNKPISELPVLDDIINTDSLVIIQDNVAHLIPFNKFKLSADNFFEVGTSIASSQSNVDQLTKSSLRKVIDTEALSLDENQVDTTVYTVIDSDLQFNSIQYFVYASSSDCFIPIDFNNNIKAIWFGIKPGETNLETNMQNLLDFADSVTTCIDRVKHINKNISTQSMDIIFEPGLYQFNDTITIHSNISLKGQSTIFRFNGVITGCMVEGKNISIEGITFLTENSHMYIADSSNVTIKNCAFTGGRTGMYMNSVSSCFITMNRYEYNSSVGLRFDKTYDTVIEYNTFDRCTLVEGTWCDRNSHFTNIVTVPGNYITNPTTNESTKLSYADRVVKDEDFTDIFFTVSGYGNFDISLNNLLSGKFVNIEGRNTEISDIDFTTTPFHIYTDIFNLAPRATPDLANIHMSKSPDWRDTYETEGPGDKRAHPDERLTFSSADNRWWSQDKWYTYRSRLVKPAMGNFTPFFVRKRDTGWDYGTFDMAYNIESLFSDPSTGSMSSLKPANIDLEITIPVSTLTTNYFNLYTPETRRMADDHAVRFGRHLKKNDYRNTARLDNVSSIDVDYNNTILYADNLFFKDTVSRVNNPYNNDPYDRDDVDYSLPGSLYWHGYLHDRDLSGGGSTRHENWSSDSLILYDSVSANTDNPYVGASIEILNKVFPRKAAPILAQNPKFKKSVNDGKKRVFLSSNKATNDSYSYDRFTPVDKYNETLGYNESIIKLPFIDFTTTIDSNSYTLTDLTMWAQSWYRKRGIFFSKNWKRVYNGHEGSKLVAYRVDHSQLYQRYDNQLVLKEGKTIHPYTPETESRRRQIAWTVPIFDDEVLYGKSKPEMPTWYDLFYFSGNYIYYDTVEKGLVFSVYNHQRPAQHKEAFPSLSLGTDGISEIYTIQPEDKKPYDSQLTVMFVGLRIYKPKTMIDDLPVASGWSKHREQDLNTATNNPKTYTHHPDNPEHENVLTMLNVKITQAPSLDHINDIIDNIHLYNKVSVQSSSV